MRKMKPGHIWKLIERARRHVAELAEIAEQLDNFHDLSPTIDQTESFKTVVEQAAMAGKVLARCQIKRRTYSPVIVTIKRKKPLRGGMAHGVVERRIVTARHPSKIRREGATR